jgi:transmembrane sensor
MLSPSTQSVIADQALDEAGDWFVRLSSGDALEQDFIAFKQWQEADNLNLQAWQKIEQTTQHFKTVANHQDINQTLKRIYNAPSPKRRIVLKQIALLIGSSGLSYMAYQTQPWQPYLADYRTPTGVQQHLTLADGSKLILNTASSVNIKFTDSERLIELLAGEVLIETAHEMGRLYRPLIVTTQHGKAVALGTRFMVRDFDQYTQVSVLEGAVRITSKGDQLRNVTIQAGESIRFSLDQFSAKSAVTSLDAIWAKGFIVVDNMRLDDFVQTLSRYRPGLLQCDPAVAHIQISGSFPIQNIDLTLQNIADKFPVKVLMYTKYFTKITAL